MPKKMTFKLVVEDPERSERLECDIDTVDRGIAALEIFFRPILQHKIRTEGMTREQKKHFPRIAPRRELRFFCNRITNTETGEVLKDFPLKAKRAKSRRDTVSA